MTARELFATFLILTSFVRVSLAAPQSSQKIDAAAEEKDEEGLSQLDSASPNYEWKASANVIFAGLIEKPIPHRGFSHAKDGETAKKDAEEKFREFIEAIDPLAEIDEDSLDIIVRKLPKIALDAETMRASVRILIHCNTSEEFEFLGEEKTVDSFVVKAYVEPEFEEAFSLQSAVSTRSSAVLHLWQGPVFLDDKGVPLTVTLYQHRRRVDIKGAGWPEEDTKLGKFRLTMRNAEGRLKVEFKPLEICKLTGPDDGKGAARVNRIHCNAKGYKYQATVVAVSPQDEARFLEELKIKREERQAKIKPRADEPVSAIMVHANCQYKSSLDGNRGEGGPSKLGILTADRAMGEAYCKRAFGLNDEQIARGVIFGESKENLRGELLSSWPAYVALPFNKHKLFDEATLQVSFSDEVRDENTFIKGLKMPPRQPRR